MKKAKIFALVLLSLIIVLPTLVKAQTIDQVAGDILGKVQTRNTKPILKTDFGSMMFNCKTKKGYCSLVIVKLTNGQYLYDSIINSTKYAEIKIGSTWTDLIYNYEPVESKKFKTLEEASLYYNSIDKDKYDVFKQLHIYKHSDKEKYLVGVFNFEMPVNSEMFKFDADRKKLDKNYTIVK